MGARIGLEQILERLADHALPPRARDLLEKIQIIQVLGDGLTAHDGGARQK